MSAKYKDITNVKFGRLIVRWPAGKKDGMIHWLCECSCGNLKIIPRNVLASGRTVSCGCKHSDDFKKMVRAQTGIKNNQFRHGLSQSREGHMFYHARSRARKNNLPFNIEISDVIIPKKCPLLGIELSGSKSGQNPNNPSLDKIIPKLGYVKGNVHVISHRANTLKGNASLSELKTLVENLEKICG